MALLDHFLKPIHIHPLMNCENMKLKSCIFGKREGVDGLCERSMQAKTILVEVRCQRTDATAGLLDSKPGLTRAY